MPATTTSSVSSSSNLGGKVDRFFWNWQGQQVTIAYETLGQGKPVLLLPSFSTVSTRTETREIARSLSSRFQVVALDWLGFGESDRPPLDYQPRLYHQLLKDFVRSVFKEPIVIFAAGHAAGYALQLAKECSETVSKLILVAPTWRGPLRAMGVDKSIASMVRQLVRSPILGQFLYKLNTTSSFLRSMYGRHVFVSRDRLTPEFIAEKRKITQQPGARFAPAAFVTGAIDPVLNREEFLSYFPSLSIPILLVIAEQAPPISKGEMEAIAQLPKVQTVRLPGALGIHEEFAPQVVAAIEEWKIGD
jgi:pimeloyl-ACP methyl ester carboxylesterase